MYINLFIITLKLKKFWAVYLYQHLFIYVFISLPKQAESAPILVQC